MDLTLLGENFTPVHGAIGGALIGLSAAILLIANGRLAGISGILEGAINPAKGGYNWRLMFLIAMPVGAWLVVTYLPEFAPGKISFPSSWPLLVVGGLLVGFGTRLGSGCTSGHGVCGIPRFSVRSILATAIFFGTAAAVVFIMRHTGLVGEVSNLMTQLVSLAGLDAYFS